jgi:hypothetical protein
VFIGKRWYCGTGDGCHHTRIGRRNLQRDGDGDARATTRNRINVYLTIMPERPLLQVLQSQAGMVTSVMWVKALAVIRDSDLKGVVRQAAVDFDRIGIGMAQRIADGLIRHLTNSFKGVWGKGWWSIGSVNLYGHSFGDV